MLFIGIHTKLVIRKPPVVCSNPNAESVRTDESVH
jgi:hypothetical protein